MTKIFIAGSMNIKCLDPKVTKLIDDIITKNCDVVVGDAKGVDTSIQSYLFERGVQNVVVYCSGPSPRNNLGNWTVSSVSADFTPGSRAFFTAKDIQMAQDADYGLMIWDTKSTGTLSNVIELLKNNKECVVFINKIKKIKTISDVTALEELIIYMSDHALIKADKKIGLLKNIDEIKHHQLQMFA